MVPTIDSESPFASALDCCLQFGPTPNASTDNIPPFFTEEEKAEYVYGCSSNSATLRKLDTYHQTKHMEPNNFQSNIQPITYTSYTDQPISTQVVQFSTNQSQSNNITLKHPPLQTIKRDRSSRQGKSYKKDRKILVPPILDDNYHPLFTLLRRAGIYVFELKNKNCNQNYQPEDFIFAPDEVRMCEGSNFDKNSNIIEMAEVIANRIEIIGHSVQGKDIIELVKINSTHNGFARFAFRYVSNDYRVQDGSRCLFTVALDGKDWIQGFLTIYRYSRKTQ